MNGADKTRARHRPVESLGKGTEGQDGFTLLVGTFRSPEIYTLTFQPAPTKITSNSSSATATSTTTSSSLFIARKSPAVGGHSWLALSPDHTRLYTTCWTDPPTVAAYALDPPPTTNPGPNTPTTPRLLNTQPVASLSGYVAVTPSGSHLLSVGGPSGEVFPLDAATGRLGPASQALSFREAGGRDDGRREGVAHGGFGGLRWGAHSVDVAPGGGAVYVADIGHNCIWTYALDEKGEGKGEGKEGADGGKRPVLRPGTKHVSPRAGDGPRHCWPHPRGRVLYCVQEHSSMVDAFAVGGEGEGEGEGPTLAHMQGFTILPAGRAAEDFWADEVRTSNRFFFHPSSDDDDDDGGGGGGRRPKYLYASTRGLKAETKGFVAVYALGEEGAIDGPALAVYETRTSGGLANAVEPAPRALYEKLGAGGGQGEEFIALTDSEEGWVVILGWDGERMREVAAVRLEEEDGGVVGAATAVWL